VSRKRKDRPTVPAPDPGDERATLHLLFARADYLRERWLEASKDAHDAVGTAAATSLESGYGIPIWMYVTLHLASLHTVVEGWDRLRLSGSEIDSVLKDQAQRHQLKALRDGVFHFGAVNNPAIMSVLSNTEMLDWAKKLHAAFRTYFAT
jgi:hypothetical protein